MSTFATTRNTTSAVCCRYHFTFHRTQQIWCRQSPSTLLFQPFTATASWRTSPSKTTRSRGELQRVKTSEHWWEEEEEYDALTDSLRPKIIALVVTPPNNEALALLRAYLAPAQFTAGFCSDDAADFASELWKGRDSAPFFLKMRARCTLNSGSSVADFLGECLQQNWRVDLDAGLGIEEPPAEQILVVAAAEMVGALLKSCCGAGKEESCQPGAVALLRVEGTAVGQSNAWESLEAALVMAPTNAIDEEIIILPFL